MMLFKRQHILRKPSALLWLKILVRFSLPASGSLFLTISVAAFIFFFATESLAEVKDSVVKIYVVSNRYNYHEPWQTTGQRLNQGSGCIISGNRILTNAHVVSDQTFVQVRRAGQAKKYTARIEVVGHDCDLAILRVDDPDFFTGSSPLSIGELPKVRDKVAVFGYPDGGDTLSITEGIVSRVEHLEYAHSQVNLLAGQIDAPISSGNSGGPVIMGETIVGIAFQGLYGPNIENIGYMVPSPVIQNFLTDVTGDHFDGIPEMGIKLQKMENPDLRRKFKMPPNRTGVMVTKVYPDSPAQKLLKPDDIILSVDDNDVENDGTIIFRKGERTYLGYAWQKKQMNEKLSLKISRYGKISDIVVNLNRHIGFERVVANKQYDQPATYFIAGGLLFEPLTRNYLEEYGTERDWSINAPKDLLSMYLNSEPTPEMREAIILVKVLADEINIGYHAVSNVVIKRVNGRNISTMADLVNAFENNREEFHVIEDINGFQLVLDRKTVDSLGGSILQRYNIPYDRSENLRVQSRK